MVIGSGDAIVQNRSQDTLVGQGRLQNQQLEGTTVARRWLAVVNLTWATVSGLPWLAPILMKVGATGAARVIYLVYRFLCH